MRLKEESRMSPGIWGLADSENGMPFSNKNTEKQQQALQENGNGSI